MFQDDFYGLFRDYPDAITNKKVFSSLVKDLFPDQTMQANLIIALYDMKIHTELASTAIINNAFAYRFVKRLMDENGVTRMNADWAVSVWCVCYGKNYLRKPCEIEISSASATGRPAIMDEQSGATKYKDLFTYKKSSQYNGYAVNGFNGDNKNTIIFQNRYRNKDVVEVADAAFSEYEMQEAIFSEGYIRIGSRAFSGCTALAQVILPTSLKEVGDYAFASCGKLTSIALPQNLMQIGKYSFASTSIKTIAFPASLLLLEEGAFSDCGKLNNLVIPQNIPQIPDKCFSGCTAIDKVTLCDNLDHIGEEAFCGCSRLMLITIPDSVNYIGEDAFSGTHEKFILQCSMGTYAEAYARKHKLKYQLV